MFYAPYIVASASAPGKCKFVNCVFPRDDRVPGKVFALIAILENVAALATSYLYDSVLYRRTVHFFAGFTFVFGGGVELFALAIFM